MQHYRQREKVQNHILDSIISVFCGGFYREMLGCLCKKDVKGNIYIFLFYQGFAEHQKWS